MLLYSSWLKVPLHQRIKIAEDFGIIKKGSTHVFNNEVQSDGYSVHDVEHALTVENLNKYLGTNSTDHIALWNELIYRLNNPDEVRITVQEFEALQKLPVLKPSKKGRTKKHG